ncbi:enoyl-CoA hydratase/isomerase family protein [Bradyrhizobium manausense]|uniref:enoyl-CoA hydratase/isomerase family protein n=1 Tax=Bradyrhizobium manausense TaxID=989370 RepID=UPI001BA6FD23|nr:enoyl-CoA hydratase-related protein [Bradyrhizobium manausense]MBR0684374.1 enoyl-CoA hydratase/isomerase family protein [Bradyrhizobium manausense]
MSNANTIISHFDADTGVARIVFNRPSVLNAIDAPMAKSFHRAVRQVTSNRGVRCIVLSGEGRAFLAGGDIAKFAENFEETPSLIHELLDALHPAILALRETPAPVVAAVRGAAAGAGLSLVLAADLVVAADDARFVIAYDKVGASPDGGGTWFLPRKIGRARSFELMLLGRTIDAATARAYGIVNEIVPAADLDGYAAELAERIACGPTRAYGAFKRLVDAELPLAQHLEAERAAFISATQTADFREGVSAFIEKRKPTFTGN